MSERFDVATVTGFRVSRHGKTGGPPGLSAHVIDRLYNCAVVASYRSEASAGRGHGTGTRLGVVGALFHARQHAALLNELDV